MKQYSIFRLIPLVGILMLLCSSCGHRDRAQAQGVNRVYFDDRYVVNNTVGPKETSIFLHIETNSSWSLSWDQPDWVEVDVSTNGKGNIAIPIFIKRNSGPQRTVTFTINVAGRDRFRVTLTQQAYDASSTVAPALMEIPRLQTDKNHQFVAHYVNYGNKGIKIMNYCLEFDKAKHLSHWVAFRFDDLTAQHKVRRTDKWADDPVLGALNFSDYRGTGFSRGHMVASADRLYCEEANEQTFYYSNMSPQDQDFNAGVWQQLESLVQRWGRDTRVRDTLYVVKGTSIDNPKYIMGYIDRGGWHIPIAKYWYMAILKVKNHHYSAVGFWTEHYTSGRRKYNSKDVKTIKELEQLTGIDFFYRLPKDIQDKVESTIDVKEWPGI